MESIKNEIQQLKAQLCGDMLKDMETRQRMHELEMKLNHFSPVSTVINCEGCGG